MNIILVDDQDFIAKNFVRLEGPRAEHVRNILDCGEGESIRMGRLNGLRGLGKIQTLVPLVIEVNLDSLPPAPASIKLILALPRPKVFGRVLRAVTSLGIKEIFLIQTHRVEKSYWSSPHLSDQGLRRHMLDGLMLAGDTMLPQVTFSRRFKPFVEDESVLIRGESVGWIAHPYASAQLPTQCNAQTTLVVGPEGGLTDYEVKMFEAQGFFPGRWSERILSVETAVPALLGRMLP